MQTSFAKSFHKNSKSTKRCISFAALAALMFIATFAIAQISSEEIEEIVFEKDKVPDGVKWSPKFALTDEGLVSPKLEKKKILRKDAIWIQTQKIPPGLSWRPPASVNIILSVNGIASNGFPLSAYVRYGCDGVHWSNWYYMPESKKPIWEFLQGYDKYRLAVPLRESLKSYEYGLQASQVSRQSYEKLMREWWKTSSNWSSDEDELSRWIARNYPDFFTKELPFIGYIQFHLVGRLPEQQAKIKSLFIQISWSVGGISAIPKSSEAPLNPYQSKWNFDIREVQKEDIPKKK